MFKQPHKHIIFPFGAGAQFMVSRECILKQPKAFYQQIVDILSYSIHPIEGYVIERYHWLIFNQSILTLDVSVDTTKEKPCYGSQEDTQGM